jgi:hypothetical protein
VEILPGNKSRSYAGYRYRHPEHADDDSAPIADKQPDVVLRTFGRTNFFALCNGIMISQVFFFLQQNT